jgi:hypothetical protein
LHPVPSQSAENQRVWSLASKRQWPLHRFLTESARSRESKIPNRTSYGREAPDDETMTAATLAIAGEGNVRGCVRAGSDP